MRSKTVALLFALALGGAALVARAARPEGPEATAMTTAPVSSNAPAIDRRAPAKVETATFALG